MHDLPEGTFEYRTHRSDSHPARCPAPGEECPEGRQRDTVIRPGPPGASPGVPFSGAGVPRSDARVSVLAGRTSPVLGADRFANSGGQNLPMPTFSGVTYALRNHGNGCLKQPSSDPERFRGSFEISPWNGPNFARSVPRRGPHISARPLSGRFPKNMIGNRHSR